jgi:hypothetical protein
VPGGIERLAAQRAGWPTGGDDPDGSVDECVCHRRGHPDAEQVRAFLVVVVDLHVGNLVGVFLVLRLSARLDQDAPSVAVPAEGQGAGPKGFVERLVEGSGIAVRRDLDRPRDPAPLELAQELSQPIGQHRDLDLFEDDRHDPPSVAGLEEERPLARGSDRPGDKTIGRIEDEATSRHHPTLADSERAPRLPALPLVGFALMKIVARRADLGWLVVIGLIYAAATWLVLQHASTGSDRMMILAERITEGRLDSPDFAATVDSVAVAGRYYMAVGPLQPIAYLPFVALTGLRPISSYIVSTFIGTLAAFCGLPLARAFGPPGRTAWWLAAFTAFGTLLFFLSVFGNMYYLAQVEAFLALAVFLIEWAGRRRPAVLGILLGVAFLARSTTLLAAIPFGLALVLTEFGWPVRLRPGWARAAVGFGAPIAAAIVIYALYDWARFGSPLETGYGISQLTDPGLEARRSMGVFSLAQLPENVYLAFLKGFEIADRPPFLVPDPYGLSMLLVSPGLLMAISAGARLPDARILWLATGLVAIPVFLYYGGGFIQYGFRYSLDFTPFLVALAAIGRRWQFGLVERVLIVLSIASVSYGVLWFAYLGLNF